MAWAEPIQIHLCMVFLHTVQNKKIKNLQPCFQLNVGNEMLLSLAKMLFRITSMIY